MKRSQRHAVSFAAGFATWLLCFVVSNQGTAQTGLTVPLDVEICRTLFNVLWFPFSWIPVPHTTGTGTLVRLFLIGVPYGAAVGIGLSRLLRGRHPGKHDEIAA